MTRDACDRCGSSSTKNIYPSVKIAIVEDHLMFREVLRKICADLQHTVVGEADDGRKAVEMVTKAKPELLLLDLHLPNLDGFGVVEEIRRTLPDVRVLVLSSHCDEYTVFRADRARVQGFVDKNTNTVDALKKAIEAVAAGRTSFSPAFLRSKKARHDDPQSFDKLLTDRERTILSLLAAPMTDPEIATRLSISNETVEKHRFNLLRKLGLSTTMELVRYARDHGFNLSAPRTDDDAMLP
jgi:DNA-binding NarL/FixJ family response regulator